MKTKEELNTMNIAELANFCTNNELIISDGEIQGFIALNSKHN